MLKNSIKNRIKIINISSNPLFRALLLLSKSDRTKIYLISFFQVFSGVLDLAGVVIVGAVGALSIQGIESKGPGNHVSQLLNIFHLQHCTFRSQVLLLGLGAIITFVVKTTLSIIFTRKTFYFLSIKSAEITGNLIAKVLSQDLLFIKKIGTQNILFILSDGVRNIMNGILATSVAMLADISMLLILFFGLFIIDPVIALSITTLFLFIAAFLYRLLHLRAQQIGIQVEKLIVKNNQKIVEVLSTYRETLVHGRRQFYANQIAILRREYGEISAELTFQPYIGKYVIESATILGAFLLAGFEFATKNAVHAVSILVIFMAASTRIAPAVLRVQQGFLMMKTSSGTAQSTYALIEDLNGVLQTQEENGPLLRFYPGFAGKVSLSHVDFTYPNANDFAIKDVNLTIEPGTSVAIVGPSGAGKTTLVDLILGVLVPQNGNLEVSENVPSESIKKWPGSISYVPQDVEIVSGTIRENVSLGYSVENAPDDLVWKVLEIAQLKEVVEKMAEGLDSQVGERGSMISGGQKQRLGIARALFTSPKLLVLDEATSSLDGQTESEISKAISQLAGEVTVIIVAHRLSTVRSVDQVIYVDNGKIIAKGTFDEVRLQVPDFDVQAKLVGI